MNEPVAAGQPLARAFLRVGGAPVANHQLGLLLALECQRIVVLARDLSPGLLAVQQAAEARGAQFHVAADARGLSRLVTANDELVVLSDGLLADHDAARALLDRGPTVLAQPVEAGLAAGFERIDLNTATAGALRMPGRLATQLAELPADCDVPSALTRIALQGGVPLCEIAPELRSGGRWLLVRNDADARAVQDEWLRATVSGGEVATPIAALSRTLVLSLGQRLLQGGAGALYCMVASFVLLLLASGLGWFEFVASGLLAAALAALLARIGKHFYQAEAGGWAGRKAGPMKSVLPVAIDAAIVAVLAWNPSHRVWETAFDRAFAPLVLILALHLGARVLDGAAGAWMADRFTLALVLALAAALGLAIPLAQALALVAIIAVIVLAPPRVRLTHD